MPEIYIERGSGLDFDYMERTVSFAELPIHGKMPFSFTVSLRDDVPRLQTTDSNGDPIDWPIREVTGATITDNRGFLKVIHIK